MTIRPKARRFHASAPGSVRDGETKASETESKRPSVRVAVRKKTPQPQQTTPSNPTEAEIRERMMQPEPHDDGFGDLRLTDPKPDTPSGSAAQSNEPADDRDAKLAAIRAEKLSDRQLRIARRIATLHQIRVSTDEEAVLELRERGIDPSHREALKKILSNEGAKAGSSPSPNAPAIRPAGSLTGPHGGANLPAPDDMNEERRAAEIYRIQQDMARRRRRRLISLAMRLLVFVMLPTFAVGVYYFKFASPLYATYSQFQIQRADSAGGADVGGMFSSSPLANNTDSVAVQGYLTSREAMMRLNEDQGFKENYQSPDLDPIRRLPADATNEEAYELFKDSVIIGYDPTEGLINMEVIAPNAELSKEFSLALIRYAEEEVDKLTARIRGDQMQGATENYNEAEQNVLSAQRRVQELQTQLGVLDPAAESSVVMQQISQLEAQLTEKRLELGQLQANSNPVQSRVAATRGDIARLQEIISETRSQLTEDGDARSSLAEISGELRIAEGELATRQELLASAATQLVSAQIEANKQVRYLSMSISPVPPDEATYPKAFQNTLVAFLIFMGLYLMASLTVSILREQVST